MSRPQAGEFNSYFARYIDLVPDGDIQRQLEELSAEALALFGSISEEKGVYRYEAGKWSVKEVLGHVIDTERIMSYRLLCIARGETGSLPGFDQDVYTKGADFDAQTLAQLRDEYEATRRSTLALLRGLPQDAWLRQGTANNSVISARALAYIIAGHEIHHLRILKERYL